MFSYESRRSLQWCARLRIKTSQGAMLNPHTGVPRHPHMLLLSSSFPLSPAYFHCSFLPFGILFWFFSHLSLYYSPLITSQKGKICCRLIVNSILGFYFYFFHVNWLSFVVVLPAAFPLYFVFNFELFPPLFWSPNWIHFSQFWVTRLHERVHGNDLTKTDRVCTKNISDSLMICQRHVLTRVGQKTFFLIRYYLTL